MNVFALHGFQVTVTEESIKQRVPNSYGFWTDGLGIGSVYTVEKTWFSGETFWVSLKEFPGKTFKCINFEDVRQQNLEDNKKHPEWKM